ncbi:sirohydrochlorin chelatase [Cyanothece sp. BG0011]|uniref:sirohydrochlorin chelatase n=1 Tax=Cyanothece sp. BG0011 TaxID=2082950 RepID=UPI000D1EE9ED|nr:sirohydrochlorin chelatase [Cyanothece sp. BG0011]
MTLTSAYLLVSHGSRDPRPKIALERLSYLVEEQLQFYSEKKPNPDKNNHCAVLSPVTMVKTASLELSDLSLSEKIEQFATQLEAVDINTLKVVPLFLLPGVHVKEDIPREIRTAQEKIGHKINIECCPYLGSYKGLVKIMDRQFSTHPQDARIIIAHGSRRQGGNSSVEAIASQLNAEVAYWSIKPSLSDQVNALVKQGKKQITIVPYFLFTGGITTVIKEQVQQLQDSLPQIQLNLGQPLGATPELAQLMVSHLIDK